MVKEGAVLLKGGDCVRMLPIKGDPCGGGSSVLLFVPEKLDRIFCKGSLIIVYGYHINIVAGIHRKLVSDGVR